MDVVHPLSSWTSSGREASGALLDESSSLDGSSSIRLQKVKNPSVSELS